MALDAADSIAYSSIMGTSKGNQEDAMRMLSLVAFAAFFAANSAYAYDATETGVVRCLSIVTRQLRPIASSEKFQAAENWCNAKTKAQRATSDFKIAEILNSRDLPAAKTRADNATAELEAAKNRAIKLGAIKVADAGGYDFTLVAAVDYEAPRQPRVPGEFR